MQPLFANDEKTEPCRAAHGNVPMINSSLLWVRGPYPRHWLMAQRNKVVVGQRPPPPAPPRPLFATIQRLYNAGCHQQ